MLRTAWILAAIAILICATWAASSTPLTTQAQGSDIVAFDLWMGTSSSEPMYLTPLDERVVFSAAEGSHGRELWVTDGSAEGTHLLKDIRPGQEGSNPIAGGESERNPTPPDARTRFTRVGDTLYFVADDGESGREPWFTDGTQSGTRVLGDLNPGGVPSSRPAEGTDMGNWLYFSAELDGSGRELWQTNGSGPATRMTTDLMPGAASSNPAGLLGHDGKLYFAAESPDMGVELHVLGGEAPPATEVPPTPEVPPTAGPTEAPVTATPGGPSPEGPPIYMPFANRGSAD
jgi:ELWxxDGT repeat protein